MKIQKTLLSGKEIVVGRIAPIVKKKIIKMEIQKCGVV